MPMNEHVLFFPLLTWWGIGQITDFNFKIFMLLTQALWGLAFLAILLRSSVFKDSQKGPYVALTAALLWFNWRPMDNIICNFQLSFIMPLSTVILSLYCLDKFSQPSGKLRQWWGALILAIVASFSTASGFLIWPLGLFYFLLIPNRTFSQKIKWALPWLFIGGLCVIQYRRFVQPTRSTAASGLGVMEFFAYLFRLAGNMLDSMYFSLGLGFLALAAVAWALGWIWKQKKYSELRFEICVMGFGVGLALVMAWGRFRSDSSQALTNRYVTCMLPMYVGLLLISQKAFLQKKMQFLCLTFFGALGMSGYIWGLKKLPQEYERRAIKKEKLLRYQELPLDELVGITYAPERVKQDAAIWFQVWKP